MRKTLLSVLSIFTLVSANAKIKYVDEVFKENDIKVTKNITYGDNYTVLAAAQVGVKLTSQIGKPMVMDVYEPNDGEKKRPLIIFCHSGSFLPRYQNNSPVGYKDDSATVAFCMSLAKRPKQGNGYAVFLCKT